MEKHTLLSKSWLGRWCSLAALALAATFPSAAIAADRVVLGEEFTATW